MLHLPRRLLEHTSVHAYIPFYFIFFELEGLLGSITRGNKMLRCGSCHRYSTSAKYSDTQIQYMCICHKYTCIIFMTNTASF